FLNNIIIDFLYWLCISYLGFGILIVLFLCSYIAYQAYFFVLLDKKSLFASYSAAYFVVKGNLKNFLFYTVILFLSSLPFFYLATHFLLRRKFINKNVSIPEDLPFQYRRVVPPL